MILSATGHRPDKLDIGYGDYGHNLLTGFARKRLELLKPEQTISGMALGWDMAVAQASVDLGIPFVAAVPFRGQECRWPGLAQQRFNDLLGKATAVVTVCKGGYSPAKMQVRNIWMVEYSDAVLVLWDGTTGGTGNCVEYARRVNKRLIPCWDEWVAYSTKT